MVEQKGFEPSTAYAANVSALPVQIQRPLNFIFPHEAAVAVNVGAQDGGELAFQ
jgi:hypothetical protein